MSIECQKVSGIYTPFSIYGNKFINLSILYVSSPSLNMLVLLVVVGNGSETGLVLTPVSKSRSDEDEPTFR